MHDSRIAAMGLEVLGKVQHGVVAAPFGGKQQALGSQIVHDSDVVLPTPQACLVDAHGTYLAHVVDCAGLLNIVLNAPPQGLVGTTQQCSGLPHRQLTAQRQRQGFKQRRKARAFASPGHTHLRGLAAASAGHPRHIGVQPGFELEKIKVSPRAAKAVMDALRRGVAVRATEQLGVAAHLKVYAPLGCVQIHLGHLPRRNQTQRAGKQRFNSNAHETASSSCTTRPHGHVDKPLCDLPTCPHGATTTTDCRRWFPHETTRGPLRRVDFFDSRGCRRACCST